MASAHHYTSYPSNQLESPYSLIRCVCCKNSAGSNPYLFQCLHSICENCLTRFNSKSAKCTDCGLHVGQSAYPIISHFIQPQTKMPVLMCVCKSFNKVADFYCVTCRTPLCQPCRNLVEHNWCKVVSLYCDFHCVPWSGFCTSCNCAFCSYCETNVSIHGFHNLIHFANPLPDLLNDLSDTETNFEKEFEKFKSVSQILKDHDDHPLSTFVCQSLDRMVAHCFEVLTLLILAKNSTDERRLFWLKRRSRLQLTKIQGRFAELMKEINKIINKPNVSQKRPQQNIFEPNRCLSTDFVGFYEHNFTQNLSHFVPYGPPTVSNYGNDFAPFMQSTLVSSQNPYLVHQTDQNLVETNRFPSHFNRNINFSNAESLIGVHKSCYLPTNEYFQANILPISSAISPSQWQQQYENFDCSSPEASFLITSPRIMDDLLKSENDLSAQKRCNCCNLEYSKDVHITTGLDSSRSTPKLVIDEEYDDKKSNE